MTWDALRNMGVPISYDAFAARWDSEDEGPILKKLVDKFDGNGLTLKTQESEPEQGQAQTDAEGEVSRMAKRATKLGK